MSARTTRAPSAANSRPSAAPWPRAPPVMIATLPSSRPISAVSCRVLSWCSGRGALGAHDPHGEELRPAPVRVAEGDPGAVDLVGTGLASDLHGGFGEPDHARCADRVRGQDPAGRVPGDVA